jgi:O-antigen/teichoic acid export membrane protein
MTGVTILEVLNRWSLPERRSTSTLQRFRAKELTCSIEKIARKRKWLWRVVSGLASAPARSGNHWARSRARFRFGTIHAYEYATSQRAEPLDTQRSNLFPSERSNAGKSVDIDDFKSIKASRPSTRVASGVAAHLYSQVITIITQLAAVPIFLHRWNAETYGQWLAISAVPVYLTIADVGIMTAAGNLMSMHNARGEHEQVRAIFKAGLMVVLIVVPVISALAGVLLSSFTFGLSVDQRGALFVLTLGALFTVACGLFDASYRSFGKYPKITFLLSTARITEWVGMLVGLFLGGTLTSTALGYLAGRSVSFLGIYLFSRSDVPHIKWSLAGVDGRLAANMAKAGMGFISITLGSLLTLQGMIVLVSIQLGGAAVAIFSTSRTLTRLLAQLAVLSGKSLSPEISALYGAGQQVAADKLLKQMMRLVMTVVLIGALLLGPIAPIIMRIWSHGKLSFDRPVFYMLLAAAVVTSYWQIRSVRLTATNQHQVIAILFVTTAALVLLLSYIAMPMFGVNAAAGGTLLADLLMVISTGAALRFAASHTDASVKTT